MASTGATATGVDVSQEAVEESARTFPTCRFLCANVLAEDSPVRNEMTNATVVFIDIGGNRDYSSVVSVMRVCLETMPRIRLLIVKSRELRQLLMRYDSDASSIAKNLHMATTDDELAAALMYEVRCRGGSLPLNLVYQ